MQERAELGIYFKGQPQDLSQSFDKVRKDAKSTQTDMNDLGKSLKTLAASFLTVYTAQKLLASARLGEQFQQASAAFKRYVSDYDAGVAKLRQATRGQVDDLKLLQLANNALGKGLSFDQIILGLKFAEAQATEAGGNLADVFNKVTLALGRAEAGVGRESTALTTYGITATSAVAITDQLRLKTKELEDQIDRGTTSVAQFDAAWENNRIALGRYLKEALGPALRDLTATFAFFQNPNYKSLLDASQFSRSPRIGIPDEDFRKQSSALDKIQKLSADLLFTLSSSTATSEDYANAITLVSAELDNLTSPGKIADAKNLIAVLERLKATLDVKVTTRNQALGPDISEQALLDKAIADSADELDRINRLLEIYRHQRDNAFGDPDIYNKAAAQINVLESLRQNLLDQRAQKESQVAEQAKQQLRDRLENERQFLEAQISLGEKNYEDYRGLLRKQAVENHGFLESDFQAKLSYYQALNKLQDEDDRKSKASITERANGYRNYIKDVLAADSLNYTEKLRLAREAAVYAQQEFEGNKELTREFWEQRVQLESAFTEHFEREAQRRVDLLQSIFGNTFLRIFDDILDGSQKRFEDYLGELGKALLRFLASQALLKFFAVLASGPLAGLFGGAIPTGGVGGTVGGGIGGGGGILSFVPRIDPNQILRGGINAVNAYRDVSPVYNPTIQNSFGLPPVHVELLLDNYGLAARVKQGQKQYNRSSGS